MFIVIHSMFLNTHDIFLWIGIPKTHLRRFRLAAGALVCKNQRAFLKTCIYFVVPACLCPLCWPGPGPRLSDPLGHMVEAKLLRCGVSSRGCCSQLQARRFDCPSPQDDLAPLFFQRNCPDAGVRTDFFRLLLQLSDPILD